MSAEAEALARHVHRLSVLVASGIAPASAWRHVASAARPADARLDALVTRLDAAEPLASALPAVARDAGESWRALAAAWAVAAESGAPLAPALAAYASSLRDRAAAERDIAVALAGPRSTARVVLLLPLASVLLALLMGVDLLAAMRQPLAVGSVALGALLVLLARLWISRLLRAAAPSPTVAGLDLDLLAVAASGGGSPEAARRLVARALSSVALAAPLADAEDVATDAPGELVALSRRSGAPLGALARAEAAEVRARARTEAQRGAEVLAVRLMLPLGVCVLPSFLLLGVVPMLVGLLSSTALPAL